MGENSTEQQQMPSLEQLRESQEDFIRRHTGGVKQIPYDQLPEEGKRAMDRLRKTHQDADRFDLDSNMADIDNQNRGRVLRGIAYPIVVDQLQALFYRSYEAELAKQGKFNLQDKGEKLIIECLCAYFLWMAVEKNEFMPYGLDPQKGLYIGGAVGRGKSFMMATFSRVLEVIEARLRNAGKNITKQTFKCTTAKSIADEFRKDKKPEVMNKHFGGIVCLDDLYYDTEVSDFGMKKDISEAIIFERHIRYQKAGQKTHATGNAHHSEWEVKFGERPASRMHEMFNIVYLPGGDKRKL
jgi:DNA replication protein DnaC